MRTEYVTPFDIKGRPMKSWVLVSTHALETEDEPLEMLKLGISFAETLTRK